MRSTKPQRAFLRRSVAGSDFDAREIGLACGLPAAQVTTFSIFLLTQFSDQ